MKLEIISTPRLTLRKVDKQLLEHISKTHTEEMLYALLYVNNACVTNLDKVPVDLIIKKYEEAFVNFQIVHPDKQELLGICGFKSVNSSNKSAELFFDLHNNLDHQNQGYLEEALKATLEFGFKELKLNRIQCTLETSNVAEIQLLYKLKFKSEGILREYMYQNEKPINCIVNSILLSEYYGII